MWPSVVTEQNRTSNRHVSHFSSIGQFHFIKQLAAVRGINCTPFMEKINEQCVSAIPKKRCKNFPSRKTNLGFPWCRFSRFSSLTTCLFRLQNVMMPLLLTRDNVPREIIPLCSTSCLVFRTRQDGLLSDLPSRGPEPTLPTLLGNPNHLK